ncbi:MAG: helix-turn-helix domain-containing protein [Rhodoblastus sp.]
MGDFTVIIVRFRPPSRRVPGALYVSISEGIVWRDCAWASVDGVARRLLIALGARAGAVLHREELIDLIWGDDPSGGPDVADRSLWSAIYRLRFACVALGLVLSTHGGRGFSLRALQREVV